jgi:excisionase family DNA binding protein
MPRSNASIHDVIVEARAIRRSGEAIAAGMAEIAQAIAVLGAEIAVDERELLRVKDVAEILGVGDDTVRRAIRDGELDAIRLGPSRTALRVSRAALTAYVGRLAIG